MRLFSYATFVSLVIALVVSRAVYASFGEGALRVGRELDGMGNVPGGTKTVFVNGAEINVSTSFTDQSPAQVLDRFEDLCRARPQLMVRAMSDIPATLLEKAKVAPDRIWRVGVVRKEAGEEGVLICFTDDRAASLGDLVSRLEAFGRSKNLAEFGRFHYVYVNRTPGGTHVRALWTEGELKLDQMFPASGDAAGFDAQVLPRPPDARRILSVTSAQVPYAVHAYTSSSTEVSLRTFYEREMATRGWTRATDDSRRALGYLKNGAMTVVAFGSRNGKTFVSTTITAMGDTPTQADVRIEQR